MHCVQIYVENKCERAVAPDLLLAGAVSFSKLGKEKEQKQGSTMWRQCA